MRAKMKLTGNTVTLTRDGLLDEPQRVSTEYSIPHGGGHVRDADGRQVCERLEYRGNTLSAADGDDLLRTIRTERRRWLASMRELGYEV